MLTAHVAQAERLATPLLAALAAYAVSRAQRSLSSSVRFVRRQTSRVDLDLQDGAEARTAAKLYWPPRCRRLSWGLPVLSAALVAAI